MVNSQAALNRPMNQRTAQRTPRTSPKASVPHAEVIRPPNPTVSKTDIRQRLRQVNRKSSSVGTRVKR